MENFRSTNEILDFAINSEQEAIDFYSELADNAKTEDMKKIYMEFVEEEMSHKQKLTKIKEEGFFELSKTDVEDLKISDYLVNVKANPEMTYEEALIVVMKKEKAAYKLYMALSKKADNKELKDVFLMLAREEANHKLQFESDYDEFILKDN